MAFFSRITRYPRLLEEAVREGNEDNVTYYLACNTRFKPELIFETKNPQIIRLLLACGAHKQTCHEGKSLIENLFNYLTDHQLYKEGKVNQQGVEMVRLMRELFEPSDLESAMTEEKWDFAAFLMFIDRREDLRPVLFRTEQPELVSALLRNGADRKAQHDEKSFLLHLFEKGWRHLAEEAWDIEYLKDHYLPNRLETIKDSRKKKIPLKDHPHQLFRQFLVKKRNEMPLKRVIVNHGRDPEKLFTSIERLE